MMTCTDISALLAEASLASLPAKVRAEAEAHMATCASCRGLAQSIDGITRMPVSKPPAFSPDVVKPVRRMPPAALFIAVALALPIVLACAGIAWKGAFGWGALDTAQLSLFVILAGIGLSALATGFYRQFKPGAREALDTRVVVGSLVLVYVVYVLSEFSRHPQAGWDQIWGARGCFRFGMLVSLVTGGTLLLWARQGFAPNPDSAAVWTGALASLAGVVALQIHCPVLEITHLLAGHATVLIAATYLFAWSVRRFGGLR